MSAEPSKWQQAIDGLTVIATDPTETSHRRAKAERALWAASRGSIMPASHTIEPLAPPVVGNHSGGQAMATYLDYEGVWGR